jgi:hypothetical protein
MHAGKMGWIVMRQRSDDAQLIGTLSREAKVLADVDSGDIRRNGGEWSPNFRRGVRFRIKRVDLTRPAPHEEQNAMFRPAEAWNVRCSRRRRRQQIRPSHVGQSQRANLKNRPASEGRRQDIPVLAKHEESPREKRFN